MQNSSSFKFWNGVARTILRNREVILGILIIATVILAFQWRNIKFTHTEANLLPDDHPVNEEYKEFLNRFGEEGNLIIIGVPNSSMQDYKQFNAWNDLGKKLETFPEVDFVLSAGNLPDMK